VCILPSVFTLLLGPQSAFHTSSVKEAYLHCKTVINAISDEKWGKRYTGISDGSPLNLFKREPFVFQHFLALKFSSCRCCCLSHLSSARCFLSDTLLSEQDFVRYQIMRKKSVETWKICSKWLIPCMFCRAMNSPRHCTKMCSQFTSSLEWGESAGCRRRPTWRAYTACFDGNHQTN